PHAIEIDPVVVGRLGAHVELDVAPRAHAQVRSVALNLLANVPAGLLRFVRTLLDLRQKPVGRSGFGVLRFDDGGSTPHTASRGDDGGPGNGRCPGGRTHGRTDGPYETFPRDPGL